MKAQQLNLWDNIECLIPQSEKEIFSRAWELAAEKAAWVGAKASDFWADCLKQAREKYKLFVAKATRTMDYIVLGVGARKMEYIVLGGEARKMEYKLVPYTATQVENKLAREALENNPWPVQG